ncbi:nitrilase-related carbon-nitrogen hydrolase [Achromobacter xylosoxidans]
MGLLICFDIEFPETARMLANKGAEIILVLDGMMKPHGHVHRRVVPVRALENQVYVLMANRVGAGDRYTFSGESQVADPFGRVLAIASTEQPQALTVTLDMDAVDRARSEFRYVDLAAIALDPARRG